MEVYKQYDMYIGSIYCKQLLLEVENLHFILKKAHKLSLNRHTYL